MNRRAVLWTVAVSGALISCGVEVPEGPDPSAGKSQAALTAGTLTALEAVGGQKTGIHYGVDAQGSLVLTAEPFAEFPRRFEIPSLVGGFSAAVGVPPVDPDRPAVQAVSLSLHPPDPGAPALASLTSHPPDPGAPAGKVACTFGGSGIQTIGWTVPPDPESPQGAFRYTLASGGSPLVKFLTQPPEPDRALSLTFQLAGQGFTVEGSWAQPPDPEAPSTEGGVPPIDPERAILSLKVKDATGAVVFDTATYVPPVDPDQPACDAASCDSLPR